MCSTVTGTNVNALVKCVNSRSNRFNKVTSGDNDDDDDAGNEWKLTDHN